MRKRKQLTALTLAMGLAVTGSMASYGEAGDPAVENDASLSAVGTTQTELLGRINATTLSVTLPITVAFDVDPSKYDPSQADFLTRQIGAPTNYDIVNNSATPVYVHISKVTTGTVSGRVTSTCTLTDDKDAVALATNLKYVLLAIKDSTEDIPANNAALSTGFGFKDSTANYTLKASTKGKIDAGATMKLNIYGLTNKGWSQNDIFSVKPSFTVGLTPTI